MSILSYCCASVSHREKAKELWEWMQQLEAEKFDLQYQITGQKYEVFATAHNGRSSNNAQGVMDLFEKTFACFLSCRSMCWGTESATTRKRNNELHIKYFLRMLFEQTLKARGSAHRLCSTTKAPCLLWVLFAFPALRSQQGKRHPEVVFPITNMKTSVYCHYKCTHSIAEWKTGHIIVWICRHVILGIKRTCSAPEMDNHVLERFEYRRFPKVMLQYRSERIWQQE